MHCHRNPVTVIPHCLPVWRGLCRLPNSVTQLAFAGMTSASSVAPIRSSVAARSWMDCRLSQNLGFCPKYRPSRKAVSGVTVRFSLKISVMRPEGVRKASASALADKRLAFNSRRRIRPGSTAHIEFSINDSPQSQHRKYRGILFVSLEKNL